MARVVAVGILFERAAAEARGLPDEWLIDHPGIATRTHEGLVVEPGRDQRACEPVEFADVEGERRRAIRASRRDPLDDLDHGGRDVRFAPSAGSERHEGIGLVYARRNDAPGTMILEASRHEHDAVGE